MDAKDELRRLGRESRPMKPHKWNAEHDQLLGTGSDARIAAKLGTGKSIVQRRRAKLGIPPFVAPRVPPVGLDWSKWVQYMGRVSDRDLASRIGVDTAAVRRHRVALGIGQLREFRGRPRKDRRAP